MKSLTAIREKRISHAPVPRLAGCLLFVALFMSAAGTSAEERLKFNRDIRPILAENCLACHGPDSQQRKADLRVDLQESVVENGLIVPGDPDSSEFIRRILSDDEAEVMPPPSSHKKLTNQQKQLLVRWVKEGAEFQPHWSFIPPERPEPPAIRQESWVRNPIDRFILARLEAAGLSPAPEADRRTLARRVSLDLTGLPPSPADVEQFVNDTAPDAYERYVDKLLKSHHWGEHRARYWLDAARYADTHGIHFDNYREIWAYRDWVINAMNQNMPFDQFTIEQLAGDLLPNPTLDQLIATGFNRCNITTNEGGVIAEEYLVLYTRDRTETTSAVWLGLTANCAVCHDHKFDPLTQREFYEMAAFFNNTTQGAMDGNIKDTPPVVPVPLDEDRPRWEALPGEIAAAREAVDQRREAARSDFEEWLAAADAKAVEDMMPSDGLRGHLALSEGSGMQLAWFADGIAQTIQLAHPVTWQPGHVAAHALISSTDAAVEIPSAGDVEKDQPFSCALWVKVPSGVQSGALVARMDDQNDYRGWDVWIENYRVGSHLIHRWQDDAIKVVARDPLTPDQWHHVVIAYDGSAKASGVKIYVDGQAKAVDVFADALQNTIRTDVPFKVAQRHTSSRIANLGVQDVRIYDRALAESEARGLQLATRTLWLIAKPAAERTPEETGELFHWWLETLDQPYRQRSAMLASLEQEKAAIQARGTVAHIMQEKSEPPTAYVLFRGEYDQRREQVSADTPDVLPPMPAHLPRNRLGFAQWLLLPEHPLTARVTVNRFWQEVFGTGIVRTTEDFGITGEEPSHPELLDWLAVEFRESGWDVKAFFKLMVTSATYRQAAMITPEKLEKDRDNRLLSRGPRFRMDAEMIRDYALAASGLLVRRIGGPSVKPYQPDGVWEAVAMIGSNTRDYQQDSGPNLYRRSMYTFWKRSAPPASMDIFNAPSREVCTVRRERTNTPLQALATMNDPQFVEAARHLAQIAIRHAPETRARIDLIARRLLARPLTEEELAIVAESLAALEAHYAAHPDDAQQLLTVGEMKPAPNMDTSTLAAWTMLTNELMNLDEVLNK